MVAHPRVTYKVESKEKKAEREEGGFAQTQDEKVIESSSDDLVITVTIPKEEQYVIPVWKDVNILMSMDWTSSKFDLSSQEKSVFQNALYKIRYNPQN